jgi:hypothetical protein
VLKLDSSEKNLSKVIPKIIHYCWFGKSKKPADVLKNISGWRELHPDFEIKEWNEQNFDINVCAYVREAYDSRKFAYVSDYARGYALRKDGGIYLDCDVELIGRLDMFLHHPAFWGFEAGNYVATSIIGCVSEYSLIQNYLNQYHGRKFVMPNGAMDLTTNVVVVNRLLDLQGLIHDGKYQVLKDQSVVYPMEFFSPLDYTRHTNHRNQNTVAIHHYQHTWASSGQKFRRLIKKFSAKIFGLNLTQKLKQYFKK